jgi:hypothetical protein
MKTTDVLSNDWVFGTVQLTALMDTYGSEVIGWEPSVLDLQIKEDFRVDMTDRNMDRLQAACSVLATNLFFVSLEGFNNVCSALNFGSSSSSSFVPSDLDDVIWGITEARLLLGPEEFDKESFSHDVSLYVGSLLATEGVLTPPSILAFAEYEPRLKNNRDEALALDPLVANASGSREKEVRDDLNRLAIMKMKALAKQLTLLELKNGDNKAAKEFADKLRGDIK